MSATQLKQAIRQAKKELTIFKTKDNTLMFKVEGLKHLRASITDLEKQLRDKQIADFNTIIGDTTT